jgi:hypothetical protein
MFDSTDHLLSTVKRHTSLNLAGSLAVQNWHTAN